MESGPGDKYSTARVVGGLALIFAAIVNSLLDVASEAYAADSLQLALFLGTGTVLLGVEAGTRLLGRD